MTAASDLTTLTVRVPRETADKLRTLAEADYRTLTAELRRLVEARVAEADGDGKATA